jgi:hypothetical protein
MTRCKGGDEREFFARFLIVSGVAAPVYIQELAASEMPTSFTK